MLIWVVGSLATDGQVPATKTPIKRDTTTIPKTWDDEPMASVELPSATPAATPSTSAEYYYWIPVRPNYKSYPWYTPGGQPPGYIEWRR